MSPFTRGGGIGYGPPPDLAEMGWEGSGSAATALCPLARARGGKGPTEQTRGRKIHPTTRHSRKLGYQSPLFSAAMSGQFCFAVEKNCNRIRGGEEKHSHCSGRCSAKNKNVVHKAT